MKRRTICALAALWIAAPALADEIRLKDGTKIIGTIVGFEDNSFKVQTSYGFALVRKDKITAIIPSEPKPEPKKESSEPSRKPAPQEPQGAAVIPASAVPPPAVAPAPKKQPPETSARAAVLKKRTSAAAAATPPTIRPSAPAVLATAAAAAPAPPSVREEVQGNLYINHTYGFRMFKPPGWHVIEGAQKTLPTAIVAMGTGDETTLLVVGREPLRGSLAAQAASTDRQLREIYQNYRRLSEQTSRVAGLPALERRYRGMVDGHDWSGTVVSLARGNDVFTILGTTYAESDLIQIQENVISRAIASMEFTTR